LKAQLVSSSQIIALQSGCGRSVWSTTPSSGKKNRGSLAGVENNFETAVGILLFRK